MSLFCICWVLLAVFWLVRLFFLGLPPPLLPPGTRKLPPAGMAIEMQEDHAFFHPLQKQ